MNNNIQNIRTAASDTVAVATESVALGITLTAGAIKLAGAIIKGAPSVTQAALELPFSAAQGYIADDEDISLEEARERAFKLVDQPLAVTIANAGKGAGKLTSQLFADVSTDANDADTKAS